MNADHNVSLLPAELHEVESDIISTDVCTRPDWYNGTYLDYLPEQYLHFVMHKLLCAGYEEGGRAFCFGDSGGPLQCQARDGRWRQVGVASFFMSDDPEKPPVCGLPKRPGVYVKTAAYLDWIKKYVY